MNDNKFYIYLNDGKFDIVKSENEQKYISDNQNGLIGKIGIFENEADAKSEIKNIKDKYKDQDNKILPVIK